MGNGLADGLGVTDGDADGLAEGLALVAAETLTVRLGKVVGGGEMVPAGENEGDPAEGVDPEQAETAPEASMVMVPQPMTANLALSPAPAMVVRTFMEPPHAPGRRRPHFPVPASETGIGRDYAWRRGRCRADRGQVPESTDGHKGKSHGRHRRTIT